MKPRWPKEVPILTAKDICKGTLCGPNGTRCVIGWRDEAFDISPFLFECPPIGVRVHLALDMAAGRIVDATWNDNPRTRKSTIARVWNRAMALLGYVCGNPEAKWAEQHKRKDSP